MLLRAVTRLDYPPSAGDPPRALSAALAAAGLPPGLSRCLALPATCEFLEIFFAVARAWQQ